jgi:hypothetical protein
MSNSNKVIAGPTVLRSSEGLTKKEKDNSKVQAAVMKFLKCVHYAPDLIKFYVKI